MGIPNMMLNSINFDVTVVRLAALSCHLFLLIIGLFTILSRFFSLFVYFISPFLYVISSVLSILLPSLLVQIGVGFPAALAVNFLLACYYWLLNIFSSCFLILSKFNGGSLDKLSLFDCKLTNLARFFLYQELHCKRHLFNFNASFHSFFLLGFWLVSLPVPRLWFLLYLLIR